MKSNSQVVETLLASLGGRGKFQLTVHLLVASTYIVLVFNHVIMAFHGSQVPHTCVAADETVMKNRSGTKYKYSNESVLNISHAECSSILFFSDGQNESVKCEDVQWNYQPKYEERNIVMEFDLVCSGKYLASLATTIYFTGVMLGGIVFGDLSDRIGRLPILFLTLYTSAVVGVITAFSVNYIMFIVLRFVSGVLMQGMQTSAYTLAMELYAAKHRPFAGTVTECFFGGSIMLLAGLAFAIRDWKYLQIAINMPIICMVIFPWFVPESLRWLIIKRKMEKAEVLLQRICRMNKVPYPRESWEQLKKEANMEVSKIHSQKKCNLTSIFQTTHIRKWSITLFYLWLSISISYYGLTYKMADMEGNRYLVFFIGGALELVTYATILPIMNRFGRKKPLLFYSIISAVVCITAGFIDQYTTSLSVLTVALALIGRCADACLFGIIFVYTSELYPTVIRNIGLGACCFWARAGGVLAPQINQWINTVWNVDALIIFGVLSLVAGILLYPLPETHNRKLPDELEEVEADSSSVSELQQVTGIAGRNNDDRINSFQSPLMSERQQEEKCS